MQRPAPPADALPTDAPAMEVEQKFHLRDVADLERQLAQLGAEEGYLERHRDTYYRHPARDFAQTREALRIRRVITQRLHGDDATPASPAEQATTLVTYKGPYASGAVKSRPELEWRIDPCDHDGQNLARLLEYLGLSEVLTVRKTRRSFSLDQAGRRFTITIDDTHGLGMFTEIETIATDPADCAACMAQVAAIAEQLGLREAEKKSYLQMTLEAAGDPPRR